MQPEDIDLEHVSCLSVGEFFDGAQDAVAGVVHQDIDASMAFGRGVGDRAHLRGVGDIQIDHGERITVRQLGCGSGDVSCARNDGVSLSQCRPCDRTAEST